MKANSSVFSAIASSSIAGMRYDLSAYIEAISAVTAADVARCAASVKLHTVFFLKGEAK